jgi:hypothetical protein
MEINSIDIENTIRYAHSGIIYEVIISKYLYIYGGYIFSKEKQKFKTSDDFFYINLKNNEIKYLNNNNIKGDHPGKRAFHTLNVYKDYLILFGGMFY